MCSVWRGQAAGGDACPSIELLLTSSAPVCCKRMTAMQQSHPSRRPQQLPRNVSACPAAGRHILAKCKSAHAKWHTLKSAETAGGAALTDAAARTASRRRSSWR